MTYFQPTGAIIFSGVDGFQENSSLFTFSSVSKKMYLEGSLDIKTIGATGTIQTDTSGRIYTLDGLACTNLNVGSNMLPTGAYGGYQFYATASHTILAARQNTPLGLTGPEFRLAPTVLPPTNFFGSTGLTASIGTSTSPGTLLAQVGTTPTVTGYSYINASLTLENPSTNDTIVSVYPTINGTTGNVTTVFLLKKQGANSAYSNISVQQRTTGPNAANVLLTGAVYAYQSVANAAQLNHIDLFVMNNLA